MLGNVLLVPITALSCVWNEMEGLSVDVLMDTNWQMMMLLVKVYDNTMASI